MKIKLSTIIATAAALLFVGTGSAARAEASLGINVLLKSSITQQNLTELGKYGRVLNTVPAIKLVTLKSTASKLPAIQALSFVAAANPDAERKGSPIDTVGATSFNNGR